MPVLQYFGWVVSFLLAALLVANRCSPMAPHPAAPLDQKISIRIHSDHKWPERVVLDTTGAMAAQRAGAGIRTGGNEPAVEAGRLAAREDPTSPSRLHRPPGKS